eukprot:CAMPEP_0168467336 /NCGR_PEP_ID=MMETSP0228-20121227/57130_1 /TAXON_ID=133427 /ORGANISM="Protoceratium reticulatum, Strain CCCM 535 (=CCMP 1889)" /LENGTH=51 /DNA_ID=CAMNT_0008483043 /DNA_START=41 /DNA_END=192 /DNA_ORIENTATION=-
MLDWPLPRSWPGPCVADAAALPQLLPAAPSVECSVSVRPAALGEAAAGELP